MPIHVLNGLNLDRLGTRQPEIYGAATQAEVDAICREAADDVPVVFRQTNSEAEFIAFVHAAIDDGSRGMIANPAAFPFGSLPVMNALEMYEAPLIEFHISNVHARGPLYEKSLVSPIATVCMAGAGAQG